MQYGTQLKFVMSTQSKDKMLFKPFRLAIDELITNQLYFAQYERPEAEIAAFHLDRYVTVKN